MALENGSNFTSLAKLVHEIYDGRGEIKPFQYKSALELASFELKSAKQIQEALNTSYGTARHVLSYLLEKELLEIARKTRGGKEWYARTYKDAEALVFYELYRYMERRMREKDLDRKEAELVQEHWNLIFKALFEQLEAAPLDLRWKSFAIAGLDLMLEKRASNSYGLPRLCICPDPAASVSSRCELCSLRAYSIDYALSRHFDPFSKIKSLPVLKEAKAIKRLIDPEPSREAIEYAEGFKRDFGTVWDSAKLFYTSDELFSDGKLNREIYESEILSSFRKIISPI